MCAQCAYTICIFFFFSQTFLIGQICSNPHCIHIVQADDFNVHVMWTVRCWQQISQQLSMFLAGFPQPTIFLQSPFPNRQFPFNLLSPAENFPLISFLQSKFFLCSPFPNRQFPFHQLTIFLKSPFPSREFSFDLLSKTDNFFLTIPFPQPRIFLRSPFPIENVPLITFRQPRIFLGSPFPS